MTKKKLCADDGFVWVEGAVSDPTTWTLQDSNRVDVAHIYPMRPAFCQQRGLRYAAITDAVQIIGTYVTIGEAIAAVDNACRPCSYPLPDDVICQTGRAADSLFCEHHQHYSITPDSDRPHLWLCGCLTNDGAAHRVGCPAHLAGRESS